MRRLGGKQTDLGAEAFARRGIEGGQQAGLGGLKAVIESGEEVGSFPGRDDATGAAVGRIGAALDQADRFEAIEEVGHDLRSTPRCWASASRLPRVPCVAVESTW